jgi:hypothetical protein
VTWAGSPIGIGRSCVLKSALAKDIRTGSVAEMDIGATVVDNFGIFDPIKGFVRGRSTRLAFGGMKGARPPDELDIEDMTEATSSTCEVDTIPRAAASQSNKQIVASPLIR